MKISLIKSSQEKTKLTKILGINIINLDNHEKVDEKIEELIRNNCKNIILSNEIAGFSEDIIKKYTNNDDIKIYITPSNRN